MSIRIFNHPRTQTLDGVPSVKVRPYRSILGASFRYIEDVMRELKDIAEELSALDQISRQQRVQLAHIVKAADFKISVRPGAAGPIMKGSPKLHDLGIKVEDVDRMKQNLLVIQEVYRKFNDLQAMENELEQKFQGMDISQAIIEIRKLRSKAQDVLDDNLTFIKGIATSHEPRQFKDFCKTMLKLVQGGIKYEEGNEYVYVYEKDGYVTFSRYFHLMKVRDEEGHFFPHKIIVISFILTGKPHAVYNLTVLDEFQPPGSFSLGKPVHNLKSAQQTLALLLEVDRFATSLSRVPIEDLIHHKLDKSLFYYKDFIDAITTKPDEIVFQLLPEVKDRDMITKIANQLHIEFTGQIHRRNVKVYVRPDTQDGREVIRVIFTTKSGEAVATEEDLEMLRDRFGLSSDTIKRMVRVINLREGN